MFSAIYVEAEVKAHPRVKEICARFAGVPVIDCDRYTEIFNRKSQNFRIQKQSPALILAKKYGNTVLAAPDAYNIGGQHNYYFSHMLNCLYDCRYCFLQGMYQSANYVLFINYEDFASALVNTMDRHVNEDSYYYSGYDCDSLAFEPVSHFTQYFLELFKTRPQAILELRTKSTQIRLLLDIEPIDNVVVAFSFTPEEIGQQWESKVPNVSKRIEAMLKLSQRGWKIGLRFDPLVYAPDFYQQYQRLFSMVFAQLSLDSLHSVSLGLFRLPQKFHKKMLRLYPDEPLFVSGLLSNNDGGAKSKMVSYSAEIEEQLFSQCEKLLLTYISRLVYFPCQ